MSFENIINNTIIYIFFFVCASSYSFNRKTVFTILLSFPIKSSQFKRVHFRSIFLRYFRTYNTRLSDFSECNYRKFQIIMTRCLVSRWFLYLQY